MSHRDGYGAKRLLAYLAANIWERNPDLAEHTVGHEYRKPPASYQEPTVPEMIDTLAKYFAEKWSEGNQRRERAIIPNAENWLGRKPDRQVRAIYRDYITHPRKHKPRQKKMPDPNQSSLF